MNWRIRGYIFIMSIRNLGIAVLLIVDPTRYEQLATLQVLTAIASTEVWGALFIAVGTTAFMAGAIQNERAARGSLVASVALTLAWATGMGLVRLEEPSSSGLLFLLFACLSVKDLLVASMEYDSTIDVLGKGL